MNTELKIADWARAEQEQKRRAERRVRLLGQVRAIFILLLFAAIGVFIFNHQVEVQSLASAELHKVMKKSTLSDNLRKKALNYEKQVDQVTQ
jgi:hypothetical protein